MLNFYIINIPPSKKSEEIEKKIEEKIVEKIEEKKIESSKPTTSVQEAVEEVKEQERRKCNVVLFNVPESESADNETRRQHDIKVLEALMKEGILITAEIKTDRRGVKMVKRLGKKEDNKTRPLQVTFTSEQGQKAILGNARNLSQSKNEMHKKVVVKPNLTQFQREAEKKLVEEKKRRNREAEEKKETADWVIYRGRLVRKSSIKTPKASVGTSMTSLLEE